MKSLFIIQEMKLFNLKLNSVCFLGEPFRDFFITVSLDVFISSCFHFSMFSFLQIFLGVFIVDCICSLHCFLSVSSLFIHCCVVTASATDLREKVLLWGVLYLTISTYFYQGFPGAGSSALKGGWFRTEV